jgi:integrase
MYNLLYCVDRSRRKFLLFGNALISAKHSATASPSSGSWYAARAHVLFAFEAQLAIAAVSVADRNKIGLQAVPVREAIVTAIFTGMRASELRGLPWRDVDLAAGVIHVRQRADKGGNIGPPKSKRGKRDIPDGLVIDIASSVERTCNVGPRGTFRPNPVSADGAVQRHDRGTA